MSGLDTRGLFVTRLSGHDALTGGAFGIEASVVLLVAALVLAGVWLRRALLLGRMVRPAWRRRVAASVPHAEATL